ncbi:3-carboxy-cis,cis-muconate cycloisomerase [Cladophialophora yegresii CBS 114405]|uniref:3-carboxy-cis,cis-muconate cycloisomerase n=1 Tax=Cladophialophora yegresii CBS 114405 TaxID=1182544 RepID=W9WFT7_9EURO|nr:3-carboxy-cis,cis-muconate cycloisomerase [Cladophialophora yegresii CBS 114405]EXJ57384.1 3-carboxy-cis,cis-muconate cycloisomerase [Cladophialophora yegresii CBS 114405]
MTALRLHRHLRLNASKAWQARHALAKPRRHMSGVSAIDSRVFRNLFGAEQIRKVFSDIAYLERCVEVEIALAKAQARANVIPQDAADQIANKAVASSLDLARLSDETEIVGYPILPLVRQLAAMCGDYAGKYLHWGATTQDIMDTASILQIQSGLAIVEGKLGEVIKATEGLAEKYKATPMAGRTHLQHALPVTFGYKCAVWLSSLYRHRERLEQLRSRALMVQYGGAAGTLASLGAGEAGVVVRKELANELGLVDPPISWHVARDGVAETLNLLALVGGSIGKIALDLMIMCSNEFAEVAEPFVPHRGASSTMPQKRNPISSELMLAASKVLRSNASLGLDAMVSDFERASGPWHLEWVAIPESFTVAVGALHQAAFALSGLVVDEKQMLANLNSTGGLIVGEAVMMGLAPHVGRQKAHDTVYKACQEAVENKTSLLEALSQSKDIVDALGMDELEKLCDPVNYLGSSTRMVDDVLALRR